MNPFNSLNKQHLSFLTSISLFLFLLITIPVTLGLLNNPKEITRPRAKENTSSYSNEEMENLGLFKLGKDQFAVSQKTRGEKTGSPKTASFLLSTGQTYKVEADQDTEINIIEGNKNPGLLLEKSSDFAIHTYDELDGTVGKEDTGIKRKLSSQDIVPVIIKMKVPYDKFYGNKDSEKTINDKKNQFSRAKNKIQTSFIGKSKIKKDLQIINAVSADIDKETLNRLENNPVVQNLDLDREFKVVLDTSTGEIGARDVWTYYDGANNALTGNGQTIAVIDTGVDYTHPDLGGCFGANCKVIGGYDYVNNTSNPMDDHGHGTHVAATAAGKGSAADGTLLNGVAPDAKILAYKVLNYSGAGWGSAIISAINDSVDPNHDGNPNDHVSVATMSLGGSGNPDDSLSLAVDNGSAAGVVFTIAAGNSGPTASTIDSPGTARTAITVAAACKSSQIGIDSRCANPIASFSSRGPLIWSGVDLQKPDISAPGVMICAAEWDSAWASSQCFDNKHVRISGTSMATPHMAGAAALIRQAHPEFSPDQVKQLLKSTAKDLGGGMTSNDQGAGEVNLKAAIPGSINLTVSPSSLWKISSDPTVKNSSASQIFTVTPLLATTNTLNITTNLNVPGINISYDKNSLSVANITSDNFTANVQIDNDLAKTGNYAGSIVMSENNVTLGIINLDITVKPTFTISPSGNLDFGNDDPGLPSWTSAGQTLTVTNLRTDISLNLISSASAFPAGITISVPSTVTVLPAGSTAVNSQFTVNNAQVANGVYKGYFTLSNSSVSQKIETKFSKYYLLIIQSPDPAELRDKAGFVWVHDRKNLTITTTQGSPRIYYLNSPGLYDAVVSYTLFGYVFKENINVTSGTTTVTVAMSDAKNLVKTVGTTHTGGIPAVFSSRLAYLIYLPSINAFSPSTMTISSGPTDFSSLYLSDFSQNYRYEVFHQNPSYQAAPEMDFFYGSATGLSGSLNFTNQPSDFKIMSLQTDTDQQTGTILPILWSCLDSFCWKFTSSISVLPVPAKQTVYSLLPSRAYYHQYDNDISSGSSITDSGFFNFENPAQHWLNLFYPPAFFLPDIKDRTVYTGLGPSYWSAKFNNRSSGIIIQNYYTAGVNLLNAFTRQDYSVKNYPITPVTISQNNAPVISSTLPAFDHYSSYYSNPVISSLTVPSAGKYTAAINFPYKNKGQDLLGNVNASFDTSLPDPNPPAIKRLFYFANNQRSEVYDPAVPNRLELEFDPVGGSISAVTVESSPDGTNFQSLTPVLNGTSYITDIPSVFGLITKLTLRIKAVDDSQNSLSYSFELPVGNAPTPPSVTPTIIPTITPTLIPTNPPSPAPSSIPTSIPTATPTPTPIPTLTPILLPTATPTSLPTTPPNPLPTATPTPSGDFIPPSLVINSPKSGTIITKKGSLKVNITASDSSGISAISVSLDSSSTPLLSCSKSPCAASLPGSSLTQGLHLLKAVAVDASPNKNSTTVTSFFTVR